MPPYRKKNTDNSKPYASIIEKSPIGFALMDESGRIIEWTPAQEALLGVKHDKALFKAVWEVFHQEELKPKIDQLLNNEEMEQFIFESKHSLPNGKIIFLKSYFYKMNLKGQLFIGNYNIDITESKKTSSILRESEEKLRAILDNSDQVFILVDTDLRILDYNTIAKQFVKTIFREELKKKQYLTFNHQAEDFIDNIKRSLKGKNISNEKCFKLASKSEYWMEYRISPVFDSNKNISGAFFNAFEINKTKKAEREIKNALDKEIELNELKSHFISTVSHEFRTPLANIILNTQLIEKKSLLYKDNKIAKGFKRIYNSIEYLVNMLNEISLISKDQSAKLNFNPSTIDIDGLIHEIIEQIKSLKSDNERIHFTNKIKDLNHVMADKDLLSHIFQNLINNAIRYSASEKPVTCILDKEKEGYFSFTVIDQGIGIPEEDIKYIGEPYHRGANVGNIKGTGLGMSIVKRCLALHKGDMEIQSEVNKGTAIKVIFPVNPHSKNK